jgi:iron(III) transport system permease protein
MAALDTIARRGTRDPQGKPRRTAARLRSKIPGRFQTLSVGVLILFIAGLIFPVYKTIVQVFWPNGHFQTTAFHEFAQAPGLVQSIWTTCIVVVCEAVVATLIGGVLAYLNERTDARMGTITDVVPFLPFLIPTIAGAIGWVALLAPSGGFVNAVIRNLLGFIGIHLQSGPLNIYSYPALIFVYSIYGTPFAFLLISAGLRNLDPSLEEQARICGSSRWRTARKVILPALAPSIAGALLLIIWTGFGGYAIPSIIAVNANIPIMSVQIVTLLTFQFPPQYGAAILLAFVIVGLIAIAWFVQRTIYRRGRHSTAGGRARAAPRASLGRWRWPVRIVILLYMAMVTVLPLLALLLITVNGYWATDINWSHLSFGHFISSLEAPQTALALKDSLEVGAAVATVGIIAAAVISVLVVKSRSRAVTAADGVLKLPVVLPWLVLAIGFVLAYFGAPFHLAGSWWMLFVSFLFLLTPLGTLTTDAAAAQVGAEMTEASRVSGAGGARTFVRIYLPLMLSAMAVGWALLFVFVLGDVEVSSIAAGTSNPTIGLQILQLMGSADYAGVASLALSLVVISAVVVVAVQWFARRQAKWAFSADLGRDAMIRRR